MPNLQHIQTGFEWGEISPRLLSRIDLPAYNKATKKMENAYPFVHGGATKRRGTICVKSLYDVNQRARLIPFVHSLTSKFMLVLNGGQIEFIKDGVAVEVSPGVPYRLAIPYAESELADIRYAQSGTTMYLVHPNQKPKILQRVTDTNWTFADIPFVYRAVSDVTFSNAFVTFKVINSSTKFGVGDKFQIVTTAGAITSSGTVVGTTNVGNGALGGVGSMPGSTTSETWIITCVSATAARQEWSVVGSVSGAAMSYWKTGNYPSTVSFFEQRLYFGASPQFPQHIWGSGAGDYVNLTVGNLDSDGLIVQIAGNDYNAITHLVSARQLLPLTSSTEFSIAGPNNNAISGISSNVIKDHTSHGSNFVKPVKIGREVVFIQRDGRRARAISYSVTEDANIAPDLTVFAEHITNEGTISDMAFAQNPDFIAWAVRSDGQLLSLTLAREYETTAWARHTTDGKFEAVGVLPGSGQADDVYFIVNRTIGGVTKRFIELFDYTNEDTAYMDCTLFYVGASTSTVTGLTYLNGKTVAVLADGNVHPDCVVSGGSITLQYPATNVIVGLGYETTIELLNPEFGDVNSSSQGRRVSIYDVVLRFKDTINCLVNGKVVPFRTTAMNLNTSIPLFTGDKSLKTVGWKDTENILITSETPTPFTLLGVVIKAAVN
jgi:hypothetical protein